MDASPYQHATLDYMQIASVAWEVVRFYAHAEGIVDRTWDLLSPEEKENERVTVAQYLAHPTMTPEKIHEAAVESLKGMGWKFGYVLNAEAKESPMLVPWEEIPTVTRNKEMLYWHTIVAIGIASGKVDGAELNTCLAHDALRESEAFIKEPTDGQ